MTYKRFLLACSSSIIQYFNYAIFSLAALELSNELMPGHNDSNKLLNFFAAIIITVLARPIGSVIFGHIGDLIGRKLSIIISGVISSLGALIIVFMPSYNDAGIFSSIGLIFCRMLFLSGLAGEIDGIRLYISENLSVKKQNLGNGIVTLLTQSGALTASISLYLLEDYSYGWKICFFIGGVAGIILSMLRIYIPETLEYVRSKDHPSEYYQVSFWQIILGQTPLLLKCVVLSGSIGCMYQFFIIFFPLYAKINLGLEDIRKIIPFCIILYGIGGAVWGYIADKKGNSQTAITILVLIFLNLVCLYFAIVKGKNNYITWIIILSSFLISGFSVPTQILIKQKINVAIRYRIFSLGHSLGSLLISTPTSFIAAKLATNSGSISTSLFYPGSIIILSLIILNLLVKQQR